MPSDAVAILQRDRPAPTHPGVDHLQAAAYVLAVALGATALVLFLAGLRRMLSAHEGQIAALVLRQDERLAEFAQALNDALSAQRELLESSTAPMAQPGSHEPTLRMLEQARSALAVDGAIAMIDGGDREPTFATVGLSNDEASHVARIGMPDFRGARAIQVVFNDAPVPQVGEPIRAGLVIGLDIGHGHPGTMAVLARARDRRFTDDDVRALEEVVKTSSPAIERSLGLHAGDPVPALDPVTHLYDGHAFPALLDREVARARLERVPLSLLLVDVDRLTAINARLGHLGGDRVLAEVADGLRDVLPSTAVSARLAGGQYARAAPGCRCARRRRPVREGAHGRLRSPDRRRRVGVGLGRRRAARARRRRGCADRARPLRAQVGEAARAGVGRQQRRVRLGGYPANAG